MSIELQAYTTEGLLTGRVVADGRLVDLLTDFGSVVVENAALTPFDGPARRSDGWLTVEVEELLAVVAPAETAVPFHAVWHRLAVDVGPYRIRGELPSLPGFDPARALARPSGMFIMLGHANVEARESGKTGAVNPHGYLWLNRYAVDAVSSDLELSFFFPGATSEAAHRAIAG